MRRGRPLHNEKESEMSQSGQFNVGTIVKLKSGGPEMTVQRELTQSSGNNVLRCQWFASKKLESGDFPPDSLELVRA